MIQAGAAPALPDAPGNGPVRTKDAVKMEWLILIIVIVAWLVLSGFILPRLGVPT